MEELEDIFVQALAQRSNNEKDLLEKLPEDDRALVEAKLSEGQEAVL